MKKRVWAHGKGESRRACGQKRYGFGYYAIWSNKQGREPADIHVARCKATQTFDMTFRCICGWCSCQSTEATTEATQVTEATIEATQATEATIVLVNSPVVCLCLFFVAQSQKAQKQKPRSFHFAPLYLIAESDHMHMRASLRHSFQSIFSPRTIQRFDMQTEIK